jgi:aspartate carbamoyltransferase regulatory subunit
MHVYQCGNKNCSQYHKETALKLGPNETRGVVCDYCRRALQWLRETLLQLKR